MNQNSKLTRSDYEKYLVYLYFGKNEDKDYLLNCIKRAYRDFNRTIHGINKDNSKGEPRKPAIDIAIHILKKYFESISLSSVIITTQSKFDCGHRALCEEICKAYCEYGYNKFNIGQAQKWINMTFKYIYTLGKERISGFENFEKIYSFCHVPIDNILIEKLFAADYKFPVPESSWSRINDYDEYLKYQTLIRESFNLPPLDVEFHLWLGGKVEPIHDITRINSMPIQS